MSDVENILSVVFVIIFALACGFIVYTTSIQSNLENFQYSRTSYLLDTFSYNMDSALMIVHPITQDNLAQLVANGLTFKKNVFNYSSINKTINVSEELTTVFDTIYGEGRYYIEITPDVIDVDLNFVVDGSPSLYAERAVLANALPNIVDEVRKKVNRTGKEIITATIYILGEKNGAISGSEDPGCEPFNTAKGSRTDIICNDGQVGSGPRLTYDLLYLKSNASNETQFDATDWRSYLTTFNITTPLVNPLRKNDLAQADWASGSAYVSAKLQSSNSSKLVVIFPMGDELPTSSIANECMYKGEASQNEKADKVVCDICTQSCNGATPTKSRAQNVTNKAIDVLLNNSHIAIPIYSFSCDYTYQGSFTAYYNIVFNPSPPAQGNVCGIAYCGGCSRSGNDTCFHQECSSSITDLMTQVATQTGGGSYINLANLQTLSGVIQTNVFREIDEYKISAGTKRSALVQYSVSRVLPLPNNLGASATLTVYTD